ncbi:MAG: S-layer protein, partial [Pelosinus sp.]|nr:S-layer protein [Pelosinus sp.]
FTDVPAKHWAYDAVAKLANAGIVDGYGDGTYRGDKTITRYEMAQMVAKAMAHSDKADAEQKASIDKLSVEFADELEGLNVRVTKLEKNSSTVKVTGEARLRFEDYADDDKGTDIGLRTRIHLNGQINDEWSYYGRLQSVNNLDNGGGDDTVTMNNAFVKGPILGATATIGRFDDFYNSGLMIDSTLNGVDFAFGNVLKTNIFYGKDNSTDAFGRADRLMSTGIVLGYATSKATTINGGYYQFENTSNATYFDGDDKRDVWEAGFTTKLSPNFRLTGSYGQSDAATEDTAYYAEIGYKGANKAKVGSYGAWVNYRNLEANAAPKTTFDGAYTSRGQLNNGAKGYEVGFNYTPVLNTVLRVKYANLETTAAGAASGDQDFYQAQVEFFF